MKCDGCRTVTPAQAHCSVCHRTFGSVSGFDRHRRNGECIDPTTVGLVARDGVWRRPATDAANEHWHGPCALRPAP